MGSHVVRRPPLLCSAGMPLLAFFQKYGRRQQNVCQIFTSVPHFNAKKWELGFLTLDRGTAPFHEPCCTSALPPRRRLTGACNVWLSPPLPARMRDVFCMTAPWKQENNCPWWSSPSAVLIWQARCKALQDLQTFAGTASFDAPTIVSPSASDSRRSFQMLTYQHKIFTLKMHILPAASPVTFYTSSAKLVQGFWNCTFSCIIVSERLKKKTKQKNHPILLLPKLRLKHIIAWAGVKEAPLGG